MRKLRILTMAAVILLMAGTAMAAQVFQGACVSYDQAAKMMVLNNDDPALNAVEGKEVSFDVSKAKVGLLPEPGNTMRVAYTQDGGKNMALKVMNVSKQDLRKK